MARFSEHIIGGSYRKTRSLVNELDNNEKLKGHYTLDSENDVFIVRTTATLDPSEWDAIEENSKIRAARPATRRRRLREPPDGRGETTDSSLPAAAAAVGDGRDEPQGSQGQDPQKAIEQGRTGKAITSQQGAQNAVEQGPVPVEPPVDVRGGPPAAAAAAAPTASGLAAGGAINSDRTHEVAKRNIGGGVRRSDSAGSTRSTGSFSSLRDMVKRKTNFWPKKNTEDRSPSELEQGKV